MQAMPAIQVDPKSAAVPAEAKSSAAPVPDGQFSQHLKNAGQNKTPAPGNKKQPRTVPDDAQDPASVSDENKDPGKDSVIPVGGDMQLIMAALQDQTLELSTTPAGKDVKTLNSSTTGSETGQQNTRILSLLDSIGVQVTAVPGRNNEKSAPAGKGTETTVTTAGSAPGPEQQTPAITIENWQAQFSYQNKTKMQDIHNQKPVPGQMQNLKEGSPGEPVLAYLSPEVEKIATPARAKHGAGIEFPSQPRDANSNFIHSNLPGVNIQKEGESNKNAQQQNSENQKNPARDAIAQVQQDTTAKPGQDTPLIFTLDQAKAPGLMAQDPTSSSSPMLKLPSGTEVPHNQIVNQVIDRFTFNRTLESGNITLKLHPAELGELRMEIKVEQDNIKAHITTQNPQVQDILDRHLPRLREALSQQGLNLEQMKVTVGTNDGGNSQLFQEHFGSRQSGRPPRSNSGQAVFSLDQEPAGEERAVAGKQNLSVLI